ncbi:hypothetical protein KIPB_007317, partial [Kipferlia bialata]
QSAPLVATYPAPSRQNARVVLAEMRRKAEAEISDLIMESGLSSSLRATRASLECCSPTTSVLGDIHTSAIGDSLTVEEVDRERDALHRSARKSDGGQISALTTAEGPASGAEGEPSVSLSTLPPSEAAREGEGEPDSTVDTLTRERDEALAEAESLRKRIEILSSAHQEQYSIFQERISVVRTTRDREIRKVSELEARLAESEAENGELLKDVEWERERKEREREAAVEAEEERDSLRTELESLAREREESRQPKYQLSLKESKELGLRLRRKWEREKGVVKDLNKSLAQAQDEIAKHLRDKRYLNGLIDSLCEERHNLTEERDNLSEELAYLEDQGLIPAQREREAERER